MLRLPSWILGISLLACGPMPKGQDRPIASTSASAVANAAPAPTLNVTAHAVEFDGDTSPVFSITGDSWYGADAAQKLNGADDFFITSFGEALTKRHTRGALGEQLRLVVDADVSYRLVLELLFTADRMKVHAFDLEESGAPGTSFRIDQPVDVPVTVASPPEGRLDVALLFTPDGVEMAIAGRNVQPGCDHHPITLGSHITFLNVEGHIDLAALRACAEKSKTSRPELATADVVTIVASAKEPPSFHDVARAVVTVRPFFPNVRFAMVP